jgi:hypothetical protein
MHTPAPDGTTPAGPASRAAQLWVEHCSQRNRALAAAARFVAANAALARHLAEVAQALGKATLAARLEQEATRELQNFAQIQVMLAGLAPDDTTARG